MGGKKPLRRPLWPPTRATASNYYPLGLDGAGGAAKPLLRAPKKPAPLHGRLPAFSGAVDAFERARKCFLEWRYFFSIILSEFLKNRVALQFHAHIAHEGKEIAEKAHDLPVDPIHQLIQDCRGNKVPNKYLRSPPKMQKAAAQVGDGLSYRVFCFASDCSAYLSSRG